MFFLHKIMWLIAVIIVISLNFSHSFGVYKDEDASETLVWPGEYHLSAERLDLSNGITETYEMWSSDVYNKSRMDIDGGMDKKIYDWPNDDFDGYVKTVYPYSDDAVTTSRDCQESEKGAKSYKFLPDGDKFEYAGEAEHEGQWLRVWELKENLEDEMWKEFTVYTRQEQPEYDIPVQYVQKVFYKARGMRAGHSVTNYFKFSTTVSEDDFDGHADGCFGLSKQGEDFHEDLKFLHHSIDSHVDIAFHSYKKHHKKQYSGQTEHEIRKNIFKKNWAFINNHNKQNLSYKMRVNKFADYTPEERALLRGTRPSRDPGTHPFPHSDEEVKLMAEQLPESYDMRIEGVISPIKNQASCGSCWAFSSTAAVEAAVARSNGGRLVDLSEQSLVDCAWGYANKGCNGGHLSAAFRYILETGIPLEEEYGAYLQQNGYCHVSNITERSRIKGFAMSTPLNAEALKVALTKYGPAAVNINFSDAMEFYSSGVFYDPTCNSGSINHGVTVIGYGSRDGTDYWLVRNSHGEDWGEGGYMLLSALDNNCFLLGSPYYPIV